MGRRTKLPGCRDPQGQLILALCVGKDANHYGVVILQQTTSVQPRQALCCRTKGLD